MIQLLILNEYLFHGPDHTYECAGEFVTVPKNVLVKKDVIYIEIVHGLELISRAKPGRCASIVILIKRTNVIDNRVVVKDKTE